MSTKDPFRVPVILFAIIIICLSGSAYADKNDSGNDLFHACNAGKEDCDIPIRAVYDTLEFNEYICPPSDISNEQVKKLVMKNLSENPKERSKPSLELMVVWFTKSWPCK
ncbi:Rap1a/Tai family immunity protein [Kiloniella majae]|uniref:Rap1a/Tai family immunity protein n=1 Tax=Kiloniella majae TaxID=1938558 RepID=UPI000F7694E0|nr:Rap1a/Tai family immunity protein [Kiloniella majae]